MRTRVQPYRVRYTRKTDIDVPQSMYGVPFKVGCIAFSGLLSDFKSSRRPKGEAVTVATRKHQAMMISNFMSRKTSALIFLNVLKRSKQAPKMDKATGNDESLSRDKVIVNRPIKSMLFNQPITLRWNL